MKKGFTLIELLAVIVILAIIALIAVPIVINIINGTKEESEEKSAELYMKGVEQAIADYQLNNPQEEFNPTKCTIDATKSGKIVCTSTNSKGEQTSKELEVKTKGKSPTEGIITIENGKITRYDNLKIDKKYIHKDVTGKVTTSSEPKDIKPDIIGKIVTDSLHGEDYDGNTLQIGNEVEVEVKKGTKYRFYVLSIEDDKVNLIMNNNICENTEDQATSSNQCRYAWHAGTNDNNYGPDTAMTKLYNATKNWNYVEDIVMDYQDENNQSSTDNGYIGIATANGITTIEGKNSKTSIDQTIGTSEKPLKARLPKESEVKAGGCTGTAGSCPLWLMENIAYSDTNNDKYSMNNNNGFGSTYGYWLLSSYSGNASYARGVFYDGGFYSRSTTYSGYGVRPVITLSNSSISG